MADEGQLMGRTGLMPDLSVLVGKLRSKLQKWVFGNYVNQPKVFLWRSLIASFGIGYGPLYLGRKEFRVQV